MVKERKGGVYIIKRGHHEVWSGTWNSWVDQPDDHRRLEWTDRTEAVKVLRALRRLMDAEDLVTDEVHLAWTRWSKNRELTHHWTVNTGLPLPDGTCGDGR